MRRLVKFVAACLFVPLVAITLMSANAMQMLTLILYPFSTALFRQANRWISGSWFGFLRWVMEVPLQIQIEQKGDALPKKKTPSSLLITKPWLISQFY